MKYQFPFQKVLDVKEKEQEAAKQEFGSTKQRQIELDQKLENLLHEKEKIFNQYNHVNKKTVWQILEVQQELDHLNQIVNHLSDQSRLLHQEVEQKQEVLIEKTKEAKVWNIWKDKSKQAFLKEQGLKEQAMLDEMAVLRYSHKI